MKAKILSLVLLTAIVLLGIASAATFTATLDGDLTKADDTVVLTITDTSGLPNAVTISAILDITDGGNPLSISGAGLVNVPASGSETVDLIYTGDTSNFAYGIFPTDVVLTSGVDTETLILEFNSEFCDAGCTKDGEYTDAGKTYELEMEIDDVDLEGFGDEKDNEWYPLDNIVIDIKLDNNGDEDIDDIMIEVCFYDEGEDKCILDEDDMDVDDDFKIKDGDDKTVTISYQVDPDEIDEAGDYVLYVKAYSDDKDIGEENLCLEDSKLLQL